MKKILFIVLVLIAFIIISVYLFIPRVIIINKLQVLPIPAMMANRSFNTDTLRAKWWPVKNTASQPGNFFYNDYTVNFSPPFELFFQKIIFEKNTAAQQTLFHIESLGADSSVIKWTAEIKCTASPFDRIREYFRAVRIKKAMDAITASFAAFSQKNENIYGISIAKIHVVDSVLISEKKILDTYPGTGDIYALASGLNEYALSQQAQQTNPAMLNITKIDSTHFEIQVAIPINHSIRENQQKKIKHMLYGGYLLTTTVYGGPATVDRVLEQLENYRKDHQMLSPAIPYQLLVTDRRTEPDSTKWETKICYPVY
jgi:effector-binding domain-containing protein